MRNSKKLALAYLNQLGTYDYYGTGVDLTDLKYEKVIKSSTNSRYYVFVTKSPVTYSTRTGTYTHYVAFKVRVSDHDNYLDTEEFEGYFCSIDNTEDRPTQVEALAYLF